MALPTQANIVTLDFSKNGTPWCQVPAKSTVDPSTLDYSKDGTPWGVNVFGGPVFVAISIDFYAGIKSISFGDGLGGIF